MSHSAPGDTLKAEDTAARRSLRPRSANAIWSTAATAAAAGTQWLVFLLLARAASLPVAGAFALGMAVSAPILMFVNFQLRSLQSSTRAEGFSFDDFLTLRCATALVGGALSSLVILAVGGGTVALLTALWRSADALADVVQGHFQSNERMDLAAIGAALRAVIGLAGFSLILINASSASGAIAWLAVASVATFLFAELPAARRVGAKAASAVRATTLWRLAALGLPYGLITVLLSLTAQVPRYVLPDATSLALYVGLSQFLILGGLLVSSLAQATLPRTSRLLRAGDVKAGSRLLISFTGSMTLLGAGVAAFFASTGDWLPSLLFGAGFSGTSTAMSTIGMAAPAVFASTAMGFAVTFAGMRYPQLVLGVVQLGLMFALSLALIPLRGVDGAAIAFLIVSWVQAVGLALLAWTKFRTGALVAPAGGAA